LALYLTVFDIGLRTFIAINFPPKIAAKPLRIETRLLLTAYGKSPAPSPMTPTTYRRLEIHEVVGRTPIR